jgi:hypothetical protein
MHWRGADSLGGTQMKKNVGQLGVGGFVGIGILLAFGLIFYGRFHFEQNRSPQDATATRLNDLEKKSIETQTKLDHVQDALNEIRSKMAQGCPAKPKRKTHH